MDNREIIPVFPEAQPQPPGLPEVQPQPPVVSFSWVRVMVVVVALITLSLAALFLTPMLMLRWWQTEAQAEADAAYLKRQAELKAESEAANDRLEELDRRVQFVSLGFREVTRKVAPAVVTIANEAEILNPALNPFDPFDLETGRKYVQQGEGSGVIVKPGVILTNYHVVANAQQLRVTFANGESVTVKPQEVSADALTDLAVIRLPKSRHTSAYDVTAEFADSDKDVQVGDWVLAIGSPFGLKQTVTVGIISAKGRAISAKGRVKSGILDYVDLLQTDAAVNPGNSGGPLFNQYGRLVGINAAIASENGGNQGIAFAIPSNTAREICNQLIEHGEVVRGYMGLVMQEIPPSLESSFNVSKTGGVVVSGVLQNSPAHLAGIRPGDVIVRFDHKPIGPKNSLNNLRHLIAQTKPGTAVPIDVLRNGKPLTVEVTIVKRP